MISFEQAQRLSRLQNRVWNALGEALREDGHRKSSDGMITVSFQMPPAFDWNAAPTWQISLWSYVLLPDGREKIFEAPTFEGVLSQAEAFAGTICMEWEFRQFDREMGGPEE